MRGGKPGGPPGFGCGAGSSSMEMTWKLVTTYAASGLVRTRNPDPLPALVPASTRISTVARRAFSNRSLSVGVSAGPAGVGGF